MQKWMRLAQRDLGNMRRAVNSLELARVLEEPMATIKANASRVCITVVPIEKTGGKERDLLECATMIANIRRGYVLSRTVSNKTVARLANMFMAAPPEFEINPEESAVDAVKRLSATVSRWKKMANDGISETPTLVMVSGGGPGIMLDGEDSGADVAEATDFAAGSMVWRTLAKILDDEKIEGLAILGNLGIENVRRYKNLDLVSKSAEASPNKRWEATEKKFSLALQEALEEIRAQSEIVKERRDCRWEVPPEHEGEIYAATRGNGRTEIEDGWRLRAEYPGLYKMMINARTELELEARELKKNVRFATKEGVPSEFVRECVKMGINDSERMIDLFLASGKGKEEAEPESEVSAKIRVWKARRPQNGNAAKAAEGTENGRRQIVNKEDVVGAIQLSDEARAHIRDAGFSPRDVLNAMVKGFNMGQKQKAAVGGGHLRGDIIRRNIRRYLEVEYSGRNAEKPDVEGLLDYLKSIEVVHEFGSSACTRTKDDAMSIETNPGNAIGKGIITSVNAVLIEMRRN